MARGWRDKPCVVIELSLNLEGPPAEGEMHPETTPVGPFPDHDSAERWALTQCRKYGGGSFSIAPLRAPEEGQ